MIRVAINGLQCERETIDDALERDGKGDEIFVTFSVSVNGTLQHGRSATYGDVNKFPDRVLAGTRSDRGGIKTGDAIPHPIKMVGPLPLPRPPMSPEPKDGFPIVLFQGDVHAGDRIAIAPLVWEADGSGQNPKPALDVAAAFATAIGGVVSAGTANPLPAAIGTALSEVLKSIGGILGESGDRIIGTEVNTSGPLFGGEAPFVMLTPDTVGSLLSHNEGLGPGLFTMRQTDPPKIGSGTYKLFVHVSQV